MVLTTVPGTWPLHGEWARGSGGQGVFVDCLQDCVQVFFFFFRELPDRWACFPSLPEVLLLKPLVKIINISSGQLNIDFFFTTYAKLFLF